ncbi:trypsin-like serine peptidase [Noviherbaspirillum aerium]|uniref:trypsin-like serine peptidase n=1 Tax=Noviherbaspirillum aerium TaxID=2588497 RepID=UPI00124E2F9F|nr:serine protease [Noviherbaspirillum aerium]
MESSALPAPLSRISLAFGQSAVGLETNTVSLTAESAGHYLRSGGMAAELKRVKQKVSRDSRIKGDEIVRLTEHTMTELAKKIPLSLNGRVGLEALIMLRHRPALRTVGGDLDLSQPEAEEWHDRLLMAQHPPTDLAHRIRAVGRIDLNGDHCGTGFLVGQGLMLTNRHVLQDIAIFEDAHWRVNEHATIDFADAPNAFHAELRFALVEVVCAGPDLITDTQTGWTHTDAALLRVEISNKAGGKLPTPIPLDGDARRLGGYSELLVIGYPARPSTLPRDAQGDVNEEVIARIGELFPVYGVRTVSPGAPRWNQSRDYGWAFAHDATTLEGSSGSCVLSFGGLAFGLHFGGDWLRANFAHGLARQREQQWLRQAGLVWTDR